MRGSTVRIGTYDQRGVDLPLDDAVREAVAGPTRPPDWTDAALLERFWFDGDAQWAPIGLLSGGERRRLQLVLLLRQAPNVLLLDEPTNDLDLDTLRALEDLLEDWPGALVVVSHDRAFLERTVTDVIVLDGKGTPAGARGLCGLRGRAPRPPARPPGRPPRRPQGRSPPPAPAPGPSAAARPAPARGPEPWATGRPASRSPSTLRHQMREAEAEMRRLAAARPRWRPGAGEAPGPTTPRWPASGARSGRGGRGDLARPRTPGSRSPRRPSPG